MAKKHVNESRSKNRSKKENKSPVWTTLSSKPLQHSGQVCVLDRGPRQRDRRFRRRMQRRGAVRRLRMLTMQRRLLRLGHGFLCGVERPLLRDGGHCGIGRLPKVRRDRAPGGDAKSAHEQARSARLGNVTDQRVYIRQAQERRDESNTLV